MDLCFTRCVQPLRPEICSVSEVIGGLPRRAFNVLGIGRVSCDVTRSCDFHLASKAIKVNAAFSPRLGTAPCSCALKQLKRRVAGSTSSGSQLESGAETGEAPRVGGALGAGQNPVLPPGPARSAASRPIHLAGPPPASWGLPPLAPRRSLSHPARPRPMGNVEANLRSALGHSRKRRGGGWRRDRITDLVAALGRDPNLPGLRRPKAARRRRAAAVALAAPAQLDPIRLLLWIEPTAPWMGHHRAVEALLIACSAQARAPPCCNQP